MVKRMINRIIDAVTEDTSRLSTNERLERLEESRDRLIFIQIANLAIIIYMYLTLMTVLFFKKAL